MGQREKIHVTLNKMHSPDVCKLRECSERRHIVAGYLGHSEESNRLALSGIYT